MRHLVLLFGSFLFCAWFSLLPLPYFQPSIWSLSWGTFVVGLLAGRVKGPWPVEHMTFFLVLILVAYFMRDLLVQGPC